MPCDVRHSGLLLLRQWKYLGLYSIDGAITNALKGAAPFLNTIHNKVFFCRKYLTAQSIPKIPIFAHVDTIQAEVSCNAKYLMPETIVK